MAVIIGVGTTVSIDGTTDGFQSVNWSNQMQTSRLWQVGSWSPYKTQVTKIVSVNVTTYAGVLQVENLVPSSDCTDSSAVKTVVINPESCGGAVTGINITDMFVSSYSYSKGDPTAFGTESWQLQKWVESDASGADFLNLPAPTTVLQGITEGSYSRDDGTINVGVVMSTDGQVTGSEGSVSAGSPGIGQANDTYYGIITTVGGASEEAAGKIGQSTASIPLQPLYFG